MSRVSAESAERRSVLIRFSCHPVDLTAALQSLDLVAVVGTVQVRQMLSAIEYDEFVSDFSVCRDWLAARGGWSPMGGYQVVEGIAADRQVLYIDSDMTGSARFVGTSIDDWMLRSESP